MTQNSGFRLFKPLQVASDDMLNLDALRFLAAFGVIVLHAAHHLDFGPNWSERDVEPLRLVVDPRSRYCPEMPTSR